MFKQFDGVWPVVIKGKTINISNYLFDILKILCEKDFFSLHCKNILRAVIVILVSIFAPMLLLHRTLAASLVEQSSL